MADTTYFVADTETTTRRDDARVWLAAVSNIDIPNDFHYWNNIDGMFQFMARNPGTYFFHNLRFDGNYICSRLLNLGYVHRFTTPAVKGAKQTRLAKGEFSTIISDMNQWYQITIKFFSGCSVIIQDSYKLITMSEKNIAKAFKMQTRKGEIDYTRPRPIGYEPQQYELDYIRDDLQIIKEAIIYFHTHQMFSMTQGSCAFKRLKDMLPDKFRNIFPVIDEKEDKLIRQSYKGGFVYVNPEIQYKDLGKVVVYDKNSMYPDKMRNCLLPFGLPVRFMGQYKHDPAYPLYIQHIVCSFTLKPHHIPTIQIKNPRSGFLATEYLTSSNGERVTLCLTSVDLDLFLSHYDVVGLDWVGGWKFMGSDILLRNYVDYWYQVKEEASRDHNPGLKLIAKIFLNSAYGKFAMSPTFFEKYPFLDDNGAVRLAVRNVDGVPEESHRETVYTPVASFITAYARHDVITTAQNNFDRFLYADTDSVHLQGHHPPKMWIDPFALGAWKQEGPLYDRARYLRAKTYWEENLTLSKEWNEKKTSLSDEEIDDAFNDPDTTGVCLKCAGMPDKLKQVVTWENFRIGLSLTGKLRHVSVPGGAILEPTEYRLR